MKSNSPDSVNNKAESRRKNRFVIPFQMDRQSGVLKPFDIARMGKRSKRLA